jgi:hypothetical protein
MVVEQERVDRLVTQPAHPKVSLSRPTATKRVEELTYLFLLIQYSLTPLSLIANLPPINVML